LPQSDELSELLVENSKLKYRLEMLKRSFEDADLYAKNLETAEYKFEDDEHQLIDIQYTLEKLFENAIIRAFPILKRPVVSIKSSNFADYQFNSSMVIAKALKDECLTKITPNEVSVKIQQHLSDCDLIVKQEIKATGPPFVNINLNKSYLERKLTDLIKNGISIKPIDQYKRIVIDMSSPNVAKGVLINPFTFYS
jgi:arginyl-tRNA synthetase